MISIFKWTNTLKPCHGETENQIFGHLAHLSQLMCCQFNGSLLRPTYTQCESVCKETVILMRADLQPLTNTHCFISLKAARSKQASMPTTGCALCYFHLRNRCIGVGEHFLFGVRLYSLLFLAGIRWCKCAQWVGKSVSNPVSSESSLTLLSWHALHSQKKLRHRLSGVCLRPCYELKSHALRKCTHTEHHRQENCLLQKRGLELFIRMAACHI